MPAILVLCKSPREAAEYGKLVGLPRFGYRYVARAGSIRGVRNAEVHVLPSFLGRLDRHSILTELRFSRMEVFYADPADFRDEPADEPADEQEPADALDKHAAQLRVPLSTLQERTPGWTDTDEQEPADEPAAEQEPAEQPERKRRSRCKICGELVWNDEDPAHGPHDMTPPAASGFFG